MVDVMKQVRLEAEAFAQMGEQLGHVIDVTFARPEVFAGKLSVGLYAGRRAIPDLSRIAECLDESFEELRKAAAREAARVR